MFGGDRYDTCVRRGGSLNRKIVRWVIALLVMAGGGWWGAGKLRARARPKIEIGRTATVKTGEIAVKVSENGTLEPVTKVDVKSRVGGRVQRIYVKEGDTVSAGTLLAVVDPTEVTRQVEGVKAQLASSRAGLMQAQENYRLTVRQNALAIVRAEAGLAEARARLKQTAAPTRSQDLHQAEATVRRGEAQVFDARRNLARRQALVTKGFVAQTDADTAQTSLALAIADLDAAKDRVELLKEGTRREDIEAARASVRTAEVALQSERTNAQSSQLRLRDVERAQADVRQIENQLAQQSVQLTETRIIAPIGGEITGKFLEEGELVASATAGFAQGAALVTIADLSKMQVRVNLNEVDVARVRVGMLVEIKVDGVPDQTFHGRVAAIAPSSQSERQSASGGQNAQTGVVRFEVKIAVLERNRKLRPGMTAAAAIVLNRRAGVLLLPAEAVPPGNKVTIVTGTGDARKKETRRVTVGLKTDASIQIVSGLQKGDTVEIPKLNASDRRKISFDGPN